LMVRVLRRRYANGVPCRCQMDANWTNVVAERRHTTFCAEGKS
jgi:hypothetical protein